MSSEIHRGRFEQTQAWIFDLDNTLYPYECRLFEQINRLMTEFITTRLQIEEPEARLLQKQLFTAYGTTLRGLMKKHAINAKEFLNFVHNIDYSPVKADEQLTAALQNLPGRKIIFTNATRQHAERVIERLGIPKQAFAACFDIETGNFLPKPHPNTYSKMLEYCAVEKPETAVMIDDIAVNLKPAHELGMATVLVETPFHYSRSQGDEAWIDVYAHSLTDFFSTLVDKRRSETKIR